MGNKRQDASGRDNDAHRMQQDATMMRTVCNGSNGFYPLYLPSREG